MSLPDLDQAPALLYGDCDPETQSWPAGRLRPQPSGPFTEPVADPARRYTRSTYIVCTQDCVMALELQRGLFASRTAGLIELEASHSPFLSRPGERAQVLAALDPAAAGRSFLEYPETRSHPRLKLGELLAMDLAHTCRSDRLRRRDLLDPQARLVLVEMLAGEPRPLVVGPD